VIAGRHVRACCTASATDRRRCGRRRRSPTSSLFATSPGSSPRSPGERWTAASCALWSCPARSTRHRAETRDRCSPGPAGRNVREASRRHRDGIDVLCPGRGAPGPGSPTPTPRRRSCRRSARASATGPGLSLTVSAKKVPQNLERSSGPRDPFLSRRVGPNRHARECPGKPNAHSLDLPRASPGGSGGCERPRFFPGHTSNGRNLGGAVPPSASWSNRVASATRALRGSPVSRKVQRRGSVFPRRVQSRPPSSAPPMVAGYAAPLLAILRTCRNIARGRSRAARLPGRRRPWLAVPAGASAEQHFSHLEAVAPPDASGPDALRTRLVRELVSAA